MFLNETDTIAAISTPPGVSGIGIIRLSGPLSLSIAKKLFQPRRKKNDFAPYRLHLGWIKKPESGEIIEEALLAVMRAPFSFTTQDVVEFQCHGGIISLKKVLELCLKAGARLAEPGEFTRQAFEGGRIDLIQAQATFEMIRARTESALSAAASQLKGDLSAQFKELRAQVVSWLTLLEAELEFPEENISLLNRKELASQIKAALDKINSLLKDAERGKFLREGVSLVIVGAPNVGKSSLLNRLLGEDRAIVTSIPGTTRDSLEEWFNLGGNLIRLIDTAGLRNPADEIEELGIKRTRRNLKKAEMILMVLDNSRPLSPEDRSIFAELPDKPVFYVLNKSDLPLKPDLDRDLQALPPDKVFHISAKTGKGIEELLNALSRHIAFDFIPEGESFIMLNLRQLESLKKADKALKLAKENLDKGCSEEFIALDLRGAAANLGELTGEDISEEVLDKIFSEFCIGK